MKLRKQQDTEGLITVEALISMPVIIMVFACFLFLLSYMTTVFTLKRELSEKACELSSSAYGFSYAFPSIIRLYDDKEREKLNLRYLFCYTETFGEDITIFLDATYDGVLRKVKIRLSQKISKWKGDGVNYKEENVWELSNAERGAAIENLYGGNLPDFFPVIDSYNEFTGTVTMISSIDTTFERYSHYDVFHDRIMEDVNRLISFYGAAYGEVEIKSDYIELKQMMIVLPVNPLDRIQLEVLDDVGRICRSHGVTLLVKRYQTSSVNNISD